MLLLTGLLPGGILTTIRHHNQPDWIPIVTIQQQKQQIVGFFANTIFFLLFFLSLCAA
jgi:hypothetical protein